MKTKITKTYSIDFNLYEEFTNLTERKNINKSKLIEKLIKDFVEKEKEKI